MIRFDGSEAHRRLETFLENCPPRTYFHLLLLLLFSFCFLFVNFVIRTILNPSPIHLDIYISPFYFYPSNSFFLPFTLSSFNTYASSFLSKPLSFFPISSKKNFFLSSLQFPFLFIYPSIPPSSFHLSPTSPLFPQLFLFPRFIYPRHSFYPFPFLRSTFFRPPLFPLIFARHTVRLVPSRPPPFSYMQTVRSGPLSVTSSSSSPPRPSPFVQRDFVQRSRLAGSIERSLRLQSRLTYTVYFIIMRCTRYIPRMHTAVWRPRRAATNRARFSAGNDDRAASRRATGTGTHELLARTFLSRVLFSRSQFFNRYFDRYKTLIL